MAQEPEVDYAELYRRMVQATEEAIDTLIAAQRACEELYIKAGEKGVVIEMKERKAT